MDVRKKFEQIAQITTSNLWLNFFFQFSSVHCNELIPLSLNGCISSELEIGVETKCWLKWTNFLPISQAFNGLLNKFSIVLQWNDLKLN